MFQWIKTLFKPIEEELIAICVGGWFFALAYALYQIATSAISPWVLVAVLSSWVIGSYLLNN
jgi:hypothetical protein